MNVPDLRGALQRGGARVAVAGVVGLVLLTSSAPAAVSAWVDDVPLGGVSTAQPGSALLRLAGTSECLTADGSELTLRACDGSTAQTWSFPDDGSVRTVSADGAACLEVAGSSVEPGAGVAVVPCEPGRPVTVDAQRWSVVAADSDAHLVSALDTSAPVAPARCLDASAAGALALRTCTDAARATWLVLPVSAALAVPSATPGS